MFCLLIVEEAKAQTECSDLAACNYDALSDSDTNCNYCSCAIDSTLFYGLEVVEHAPGMYTCKILKDDEVLLTTPVLKR
jgi:hypothetical protein